MPAAPEEHAVRSWIVDRVAEFSMLPADMVETGRPLTEYGLDSVYAISLCAEMQDAFGVVLDPAALVENSTVERLLAHLVGTGAVRGSSGARRSLLSGTDPHE